MGSEKLHLFGEFVLDTTRGTLLRAGQPVHLRPQAYKTLKYLVENRGWLISKDQLIEEVWEGRAVTDDSLVQCLRDVRQALGEEGNRYLRNERGRGYIFDPEVADPVALKDQTVWSEQVDLVRVVVEDEVEAESIDEPTSPQAALSAVSAGQSPAGHAATDTGNIVSKLTHHKRAAFVALAVLVLAAAGVVYSTRFATRGQPIRSVAVLPFANESGNPNLEYLSDGLSESLIDRLSELPGVKVIARSSSFKYKNQEIDPRAVGKALGVEALLMGRVVQREDDLQVRAELVEAQTGAQIWGEQYVRKASDIQTVQEEIAHAVTGSLRLQITGAQEQRLTKHATENTQAYQFYLNGLFHLRQGGVEDVRRALDYFQQAVAMDPDFALAWAGVARVHLAFAGNSWLDPKEANAKAKAAAQNALRLDETLPEAHVVLALIKQHEWDWAGAEREHRRALELNPSLIEAHNRYSDYLSIMERHSEALAEIKRAQELDPLRTGLRLREAWFLSLARRYDEALELMEQTFKAEPPDAGAHRMLGFMYEGKGMYQEAVAEHEKANSVEGETTGNLCYLAWALAGAGRRSEAQAILEKLNATKEYVSPAELAALYALLGDKERAIAVLEKAFAAHDLQLQYLKIATQYDSLRSDPRFQDLVRRVGLPS
jgi:TolB-like protein/DNA-binding winged helix-turn-helix (wHTH) protein/tetratricopeptide (TPR) repeat protein